jgi:hypothetical protein
MINDSGIEVRRSSGILVGTKFLKLGFDRFFAQASSVGEMMVAVQCSAISDIGSHFRDRL